MNRIVWIFFISTLNCFNTSSQANNLTFDRLTIAFNDNSLIPQYYTLIVKTKKVYSMTPFVSYLHIKGEKSSTTVKLNKTTKKSIFNTLHQIGCTIILQDNAPISGDNYFVIQTFIADTLTNTYCISEALAPPEIKKMYEVISRHK